MNSLKTSSDIKCSENVLSEIDETNIFYCNIVSFQHRTYVHVFDFVRQDWFGVVSILEHTLITLKSQLPELTTAFIRSDNAGCYHCGSLWSSLQCISLRTGKQILMKQFIKYKFNSNGGK